MIIGFDFDGVLFEAPHFTPLIPKISHNNEVLILTTRDKIEPFMKDVIFDIFGYLPLVEAIGRDVALGSKKYKAQHIETYNEAVDVFFDDDIFEVREFYKRGIPAVWVPPMKDHDRSMGVVVENLFGTEFFTMFD